MGDELSDDDEYALAELALSEWGIGLDLYFSERANYGDSEDLGVTIPRIGGLAKAHALRRRRDLLQEAVVINLANHDPEKIEKTVEAMTPIPGEDTMGESGDGTGFATRAGAPTGDGSLTEWSWKRSWENED